MSILRRIAVLTVALSTCAVTLDRAAAAPPLTIQVRHHDGVEALDVSGTGSSRSPVNITMYADISKDVPVAFLNTWTVQTGSDGRYAIVAPIASDYFRGTIITVRVDSPDGSSASATWTVDGPGSQQIPAADDMSDHNAHAHHRGETP